MGIAKQSKQLNEAKIANEAKVSLMFQPKIAWHLSSILYVVTKDVTGIDKTEIKFNLEHGTTV